MSNSANLIIFISFAIIIFKCSVNCEGILYPRESESREVKSLDGIWSFRLDGQGKHSESGFKNKWFTRPLYQTGEVELMPVPSSFNDITQKKAVRDHIGWVWYQTTFFTPVRWKDDLCKIFLRFGSANYFAVVWLNGVHLMNHTGGYLPFKCDISTTVKFGLENLLVVALNNTLGDTTIPQGKLSQPTDHTRYPRDFVAQSYNFDYFNFAGIHRPVYVYTTPRFYIDDITISTDFSNNSQLLGILNFSVDTKFHPTENTIQSGEEGLNCQIFVVDKLGHRISTSRECVGVINIPGVNLWWPYLSGPADEEPGYLYTLEVHLTSDDVPNEEDIYRLPFGVRTVHSTNSSFLINGRPFYFRGFGRHEDYSIRGRGVDWALLVKDHNLIQWTGANSYRTSHYPYAEEILDLTDRLGIVIIDESPAIGLSGFGDDLLSNHKSVMKELVQRDKNRASVLMWSLGNEPKSSQNGSAAYFEQIINQTRLTDPMQRPITIVLSEGFPNKAPSIDVFSINRYYGWYGDTGRTEVIQLQIPDEVKHWFKLYGKPVLVTEYGAGSISGMHASPSFVWTEDYQVDYHVEHFKAFDYLRRTAPYFIGEMIWNFADFATPEETFRPWGCMKGIFTRERQPKRIAHIVRKRYWELANQTCGHLLPTDLQILYF